MKLNQLISDFTIHMNNEEKDLMERIGDAEYAYALNERDKEVANNLIRKSILKKVRYKDSVMVVPNDFSLK